MKWVVGACQTWMKQDLGQPKTTLVLERQDGKCDWGLPKMNEAGSGVRLSTTLVLKWQDGIWLELAGYRW